MTILGWKLVRTRELALEREKYEIEKASLALECVRLKHYISKCENLIDAERERADRQLDSLLQQNGLPPVTRTVRDEQAREQADADAKHAEHMKTLAEIGRESMDSIYTEDGLELPAELAQKAKEMLVKGVN